MCHKATSLGVLFFCLILLSVAMSQDLPGGDQGSTIMQQSDCYRRRIESKEANAVDLSKASLLEQSDTKFDYALIFFIAVCFAVLVLISSRRYEAARKKRLGKGPS